MPEDLHRHAWVNVEGDQERRAGSRVAWTWTFRTLALAQALAKLRRKFDGSIGRPLAVVKSSPVSCQPSPAQPGPHGGRRGAPASRAGRPTSGRGRPPGAGTREAGLDPPSPARCRYPMGRRHTRDQDREERARRASWLRHPDTSAWRTCLPIHAHAPAVAVRSILTIPASTTCYLTQ